MAKPKIPNLAGLNDALSKHQELTQDISIAHSWLQQHLNELMLPLFPKAKHRKLWNRGNFVAGDDVSFTLIVGAPNVDDDIVFRAGNEAVAYISAAHAWLVARYGALVQKLTEILDETRLYWCIDAAIRSDTSLRLVVESKYVWQSSQPRAWCYPLRPLNLSLEPLDSGVALIDHAFSREPTVLATIARRYSALHPSHAIALCWSHDATKEEILAAVSEELERIEYAPHMALPSKAYRPTELIRYLRLRAVWHEWEADHKSPSRPHPNRNDFYDWIVQGAAVVTGRELPTSDGLEAATRVKEVWSDANRVSDPSTVRKALAKAINLCGPCETPDISAFLNLEPRT